MLEPLNLSAALECVPQLKKINQRSLCHFLMYVSLSVCLSADFVAKTTEAKAAKIEMWPPKASFKLFIKFKKNYKSSKFPRDMLIYL